MFHLYENRFMHPSIVKPLCLNQIRHSTRTDVSNFQPASKYCQLKQLVGQASLQIPPDNARNFDV